MELTSSLNKKLVRDIYNIWNPNSEALAAEFWQNNNRKGFSPSYPRKFLNKFCLMGGTDDLRILFYSMELINNSASKPLDTLLKRTY